MEADLILLAIGAGIVCFGAAGLGLVLAHYARGEGRYRSPASALAAVGALGLGFAMTYQAWTSDSQVPLLGACLVAFLIGLYWDIHRRRTHNAGPEAV